MGFDDKSLLILGLIVGGLACIYANYTELASAIFGGLVGYLSHGVVSEPVTGQVGQDSVEVGHGTGQVGQGSVEVGQDTISNDEDIE